MRIKVEKIVNGGYGFTRSDLGVLLIPYSVPGDELEVECPDEGNPKFCWIKDVLKPSPYRVDPDCPNFMICGGCDFQNMNYDFELEVKREVLRDSLKRIAGIDFMDVELLGSEPLNYRNNAQFKTDGYGKVGFFMKKSTEVVGIPKNGCAILDKKINEFVMNLLDRVKFKRGGFRVRANKEGQVFKKGIPGIEDDLYCYYSYEDLIFRMGIDDFFQVNNHLYGDWLERILEYLDPVETDYVADFFSGCGFISLSVAQLARGVIGLEINGSAVENAKYNAKSNNVNNALFKRANLSRGFYLKQKPNKVVMDPPRAGLTKRLIMEIVEIEPEVVVYVSCDSATFARDISLFYEMGMKLDKLTVIDMFPRTYHMEIVSKLVWR